MYHADPLHCAPRGRIDGNRIGYNLLQSEPPEAVGERRLYSFCRIAASPIVASKTPPCLDPRREGQVRLDMLQSDEAYEASEARHLGGPDCASLSSMLSVPTQ